MLLKYETFDTVWNTPRRGTRVLAAEVGAFRAAARPLARLLPAGRDRGDLLGRGHPQAPLRWVETGSAPSRCPGFLARAVGLRTWSGSSPARTTCEALASDDELARRRLLASRRRRASSTASARASRGTRSSWIPDSVGFSARIAPHAAHALARCDGELALRRARRRTGLPWRRAHAACSSWASWSREPVDSFAIPGEE